MCCDTLTTSGMLVFCESRCLVLLCSLLLCLQADSANHAIRKIVLSTRTVTTLAGVSVVGGGHTDGVGTAARFRAPWGISLTPNAKVAVVVSSTH